MRELQFSEVAIEQLRKIPQADLKRIKKKLTRFLDQKNPLIYARVLINSDLWTYRRRIGDWRVIFDVSENKNLLIVLVIGRRKDVYR